METSVRKSVVHSWGSEQSVNTWYMFSWTHILVLPWKKGFAVLYNNFESMSYSGILFRTLSLTIYTCIIISLLSQAETVWGFIFCFCQFCCVSKIVFPFSLTHNVISWEGDDDRKSLVILVFYSNSQHTSLKWKRLNHLEETQFISQNKLKYKWSQAYSFSHYSYLWTPQQLSPH